MGTGMQSDVVFLIDFGLSKEYRNPNTYAHIPYKTNLGLTGTATFASINSHLGLELGRRDDLESLAYVLIYFLRGRLPWQDFKSGSQRILRHKQKSSNLCRGLPAEFATFLQYSRSLGFEEVPDYQYISDLFKGLSSREGLENVAVFDWELADADTRLPPKHCEGYVLSLISYPYSHVELCLGCAPRHANASILITLCSHNPLPSPHI